MSWQSSLGKMGRRRFLKGLGALGASATTLQYATQEGAAQTLDSSKDEIPYVKALRHGRLESGEEPTREPVYDTISADEWGRRRAAENATERVRRRVADEFDATENVTVLTKYDSDAPRGVEVVVELTEWTNESETVGPKAATAIPDADRVRAAVPTEITGSVDAPDANPRAGRTLDNLPVTVRQSKRSYAVSCGDYYDDDYGTDIPGGCNIGQGTVASPAYSYDLNETVMVSAGHVVDATGDTTQGPDSDKDLDAWVYETYKGDDHGFYRTYDNESFVRTLADKSDTYITGIITWDSIKNNAGDTSFDVEKQGGRTGTTSGYVAEIANTDVPIYKTSATCGFGDSGGAIYHRVEWYDRADDIYMLGPLGYGWSTDGDSDNQDCPSLEQSGGNPMEYVEDQWNLSV